MMLREPGDIGWLGFNVVVATTVARTLVAVIRVFLGHGAQISKFRLRC